MFVPPQAYSGWMAIYLVVGVVLGYTIRWMEEKAKKTPNIMDEK